MYSMMKGKLQDLKKWMDWFEVELFRKQEVDALGTGFTLGPWKWVMVLFRLLILFPNIPPVLLVILFLWCANPPKMWQVDGHLIYITAWWGDWKQRKGMPRWPLNTLGLSFLEQKPRTQREEIKNRKSWGGGDTRWADYGCLVTRAG